MGMTNVLAHSIVNKTGGLLGTILAVRWLNRNPMAGNSYLAFAVVQRSHALLEATVVGKLMLQSRKGHKETNASHTMNSLEW